MTTCLTPSRYCTARVCQNGSTLNWRSWHIGLYRVLNGMAPPYLYQLVPVSSLPSRRRRRSSFTLQLHVPQYRLPKPALRSFPVAASIFWNTVRRRAVCTVCLFLQATAKDIPVSPVIFIHHSLNFRTTLSWTLQQFRLF